MEKGDLWRMIFIAWLDEEVLDLCREYRRVTRFGAARQQSPVGTF